MRRLTLAVAAFALAACARQAFPPGGPPRNIPPQVMLVFPESGSVNVKAKAVDISFDEVVSERPSGGGAQTISDIVFISPRDGIPRVDWHRTHITIRGAKKWNDSTAYVVTLRPGIVDLHGNVLRHTTTTVFSTGATIPTNFIRGVVFDYSTGKPVINALIQSYVGKDSLQYITIGDSSGRFMLGTLPAGPYTVRGTMDLNGNHALDVREPWDTATVVLTDSATVEIYAFIHDSLGPHLSDVVAVDSLHVHATFDKILDPASKVDTSNFTLRANVDSSLVPITAVMDWAAVQKARQDSIKRADSIAGKKDTTKVVKRLPFGRVVQQDTTPQLPPPVAARPVPPKEFLITLGKPLVVGAFYRLEARNVRNVLGDTATSLHSVQLPKPPPPPPPKPGAPKPDTSKGAKADSTKGAKADTSAKPALPLPAAPPAPPPAKPPR